MTDIIDFLIIGIIYLLNVIKYDLNYKFLKIYGLR